MCKNEALPQRSTMSAGLGSPYIDLQSSSSWTKQVLARAFIKRHVHVPTCTWGTWHVVTHVEETHTESHKKFESIRLTEAIVIPLWICSWVSHEQVWHTYIQQLITYNNLHTKRLVERERLAARSLKMWGILNCLWKTKLRLHDSPKEELCIIFIS